MLRYLALGSLDLNDGFTCFGGDCIKFGGDLNSLKCMEDGIKVLKLPILQFLKCSISSLLDSNGRTGDKLIGTNVKITLIFSVGSRSV